MAAELITPADKLSGLPFPIIAGERTTPLDGEEELTAHHLFHPSDAPQLQTRGGRSVRSCRVVLVPALLHNYGPKSYHAIFKGPDLSRVESEEQQFFTSIFGCAGYVPSHGIDMTKDNPEDVVPLTGAQLHQFRMQAQPVMPSSREFYGFLRRQQETVTPQSAWRKLEVKRKRQAELSYQLSRYSYEPMRDFFRAYIIERQIDVGPKVIKKFLYEKDEAKRRAIGDMILRIAATQATEPVRRKYAQFHESGVLHPLMPPQPEKLVFTKLGNYVQRGDVVNLLRSRLELEYS